MTQLKTARKVSAALLLVTGCTTLNGPEFEAKAARERWSAHGPSSYSYTVSRSCECLSEMSGPVVVVVSNGVIESRKYVRNGATVELPYAHLFPNVEGLFAKIDTVRARGAASLYVSYDPAYGFPTLISVDGDKQIADDEYTYTARDFAKQP